jgi:hypothetical protein
MPARGAARMNRTLSTKADSSKPPQPCSAYSREILSLSRAATNRCPAVVDMLTLSPLDLPRVREFVRVKPGETIFLPRAGSGLGGERPIENFNLLRPEMERSCPKIVIEMASALCVGSVRS